jgi:hypothetical protein
VVKLSSNNCFSFLFFVLAHKLIDQLEIVVCDFAFKHIEYTWRTEEGAAAIAKVDNIIVSRSFSAGHVADHQAGKAQDSGRKSHQLKVKGKPNKGDKDQINNHDLDLNWLGDLIITDRAPQTN